MATEGFQQHKVKDLSTVKENTFAREITPLLSENKRKRTHVRIQPKFHCRRQRCCLTSKAAILILVWNLFIVAGLEVFLDPSIYGYFLLYFGSDIYNLGTTILYSAVAFLFLFYPLAGCLADIRWGRYKTVVYSLHVIFWDLLFIVISSSLILLVVMTNHYHDSIVAIMIVYSIAGILGLLGLVAFSANSIQFGIDQLHDAPMDDSILYIHWYIWTNNAGLLPQKSLADIFGGVYLNYSMCFLLLPLPLLGVTLCIPRYKHHWFLIDSGSNNPYKVVYKVLKFAKNHTHPIRRSAFAYCEDELPSRLDLGKKKYGGPFTTEEVEDVKAFLGILGVLLTNSRTDYDHGRLFGGRTYFEILQSSRWQIS